MLLLITSGAKGLENCNQVKVTLLRKKLLEVKFKILTKISTSVKVKRNCFKNTQEQVFFKVFKQNKQTILLTYGNWLTAT